MTNQVQNLKDKKFDLANRTTILGENIILFASQIKTGPITNPIINQIVRSGTSIGANYMEADGADTKKDFIYKIGICKRESKETLHWLRMVAIACPDLVIQARILWKEVHELVLIFSTIIRNSKLKH